MDDKTALAEILEGGQTGLAYFYKEYQSDLLKYLCVGLKSGKTRLPPLPLDWAEDIVQNTFIKFAQDIQRFEGRCSVFTWLCHQAYYEARSYLRTQSKYITASQLLLPSEESELESPTITPPPTDATI
jgi:RNA polymerase sigma factor (sigma-70 family)